MQASGVKQIECDLDDEALTAVLESPPTKVQVTLQSDGSFSYRANKKAKGKGTDRFTYLAADANRLQALESVSIHIKGK
jgi:hypothetical protein